MSHDDVDSHYELNQPRPYKLHIDDHLLSLTKQKLQLAHYPEEQSDIGDNDWGQGAKVKVVQRLANYWRDLIDSLTTPSLPDTQAFHVIVPSIPGFGPGDAPKKSGFGPVKTAKAFKLLMVDVSGYDKFVTQGGDWGGLITRSMAMQYPQHVRAYHCNFISCGPPTWYKAPLTMGRLIPNSYLYTKREKQGLENIQYYMKEGNGYLKQQSTRPQSLGFGLGHSLIGLLGWFVEKFHEWMDVANYTMPDDEILTFVMMH
ncbi:MAG: hypothetical protein ASARMPREDX12_007647 [Alectoria sarmentosa]|nr:MAG: hypothetical protein ASARMPREDX12_007647 [Alectoria sarmentosa]